MSLRIAHNGEATGITRILNVSANRLATSMERLATGLRINSAADDAAGLGISEQMRSQIRGLAQAGRNIQDGISLLQTLEGSLQEVHAILHRARDLAVQWNSDSYSQADKLNIRTEMVALSDEIASIEQRTQFNGIMLLQSNTAQLTFQVGANDSETISITLVDLFGPTVGHLVRPNTFFAVTWVPADVAGLDLHIADVSAARAAYGAVINRLEHTQNVNLTTQHNLMAAESRIRDADMAMELTNLTKQQLMQSTGSTMLMFAQQTPARVLDLMKLT